MKTTKIFAVLLAVLMLLTIAPISAFAKKAYSVELNSVVGGGEAGVDCVTAAEGDTVTLYAHPGEGYLFNDESLIINAVEEDAGDDADIEKIPYNETEEEGVFTFVMPAKPVLISIAFWEIFDVEVEEAEDGKVQVDKTKAIAGEIVTITTDPDESFATGDVTVSYSIVNNDSEMMLFEADLTEISADEYTFSMPEADVNVYVNFKKPYKITVSEDISDGKATVNKENAAEGNTVTINIEPDEAYITDRVVVVYTEDEEDVEVETQKVTSTVYTFTMPDNDVTVYVYFKVKEELHTITVPTGIKKGKVTVNKKEATKGTKIQITADPSENYELFELTILDDDNNEVDYDKKNGNTYTFEMPDSDVTITAVFKELPEYNIKIETISHGTLKAQKTAHEGEKVTITISPATNYTIKEVYVYDEDNDEVKVSGTGTTSRSFIMPDCDVRLDADFRKTSNNDSGSSGTKTSTGTKTTNTNYNSGANANANTTGNGKKALPFNDVTDDDWFAEDVRYAYENNLMKGITDDTFAPSADTTRAMIVTILYRIEGEPEVYTANPFTDVAEDAWYANAVKWASGFGIVKGVTDTEFAPDATITREQFAAILYRYAQYKGFDTEEEADISEYEDEAEIQEYAKKPIKWAVAKSFINGMTKTSLAPRGNASRAQASAILHRIKNAIK